MGANKNSRSACASRLSGTRHPSWRENFSIVPAKKCLMIFRAARLGNGVSAEVDG